MTQPRRPAPHSAYGWLSLVPPTPKPCVRAQRTPDILSRLSTLHATLLTIGQTIAARQHLLDLYNHSGRFCSSCTPLHLPAGSCAPTCVLLREELGEEVPMLPYTTKWVDVAQATVEVYEGLVRAVDAVGDKVRIATLREWEGTAEMLRVECGNYWEKVDGRYKVGQGVFVEGWEWEGAWRERREEGGVDPLEG